jgi:predicted SAM-dependent methyltransferase
VADAKLNLGCGGDAREGFVNHDLRKHSPRIDVAWDLNDLPWPWEDESFDLIVAKAVFEHLRLNLLESVGECWRVLRPGGKLWMKLPHWEHNNSYLDPTHYWQFALHTPDIFDPETRYGKRYNFYTERKWKIVKGPKLNRAKSSIIVVMEVRK